MADRVMRAAVLTGHGGSEQFVNREDVPIPEPGPGEVRVRVGAAGINNTDVWTREGAYGREDDPSATSGWRRGGGSHSRASRAATSRARSPGRWSSSTCTRST